MQEVLKLTKVISMMQSLRKMAIKSIAFDEMIDRIDANLKTFIEGKHKTVLNHALFPVFGEQKLAHRRAISHLTWYETRALVMHYLKRIPAFDVCREDGLDSYSFIRKLIDEDRQTFLRKIFEGHLQFKEYESNHEDVVLMREILDNQSYLVALDKAFENLGEDVIYFDWISYRSQDKFWLCPYFGIGRVLSRGIPITIQNDVTVYHHGLDFFAVLQQLSADQYDCILKMLYSNWKLYERKHEISFLSDRAAQFQLDTFFRILKVEFIKREQVWIKQHNWKGFMPVPLGWDSHKTYKNRLKQASQKQDKMKNYRQYYDTTTIVIGDSGGSNRVKHTSSDSPPEDKDKNKGNETRTVHHSDFRPIRIYGWTLNTILWSIFLNCHTEDDKNHWDQLRKSYTYLTAEMFDQKLAKAHFNQELDEDFKVFATWRKRNEQNEVTEKGGIAMFLLSMLYDVKRTYTNDIQKMGKKQSEIEWFTQLAKNVGTDPNHLIVKWSIKWTSEYGDEARLLYLPHLNGKTRKNVHEQIKRIMYIMVVQFQHMYGSMSNLKNKDVYSDTGDALYIKEKNPEMWWEFKDYTLNWPHLDYENGEYGGKKVLFIVGQYRLKWIADNFYYQRLQEAKSILDMLLPDPDKIPNERKNDFNVVYQLPWKSWRGFGETKSAWNMQTINSWIVQFLEEQKQNRIEGKEGSDELWVPCPATNLKQNDWRFKPNAQTINFLSRETGYSEHYLDMMFRYLYIIGELQNDSELKKDSEAKKLQEIQLKAIKKEQQLKREEEEAQARLRQAESVRQLEEQKKQQLFIERERKENMKSEMKVFLEKIETKYNTVVSKYMAKRTEEVEALLNDESIQDETFKKAYKKIDSFWMETVSYANKLIKRDVNDLNYHDMKRVLNQLRQYIQYDDDDLLNHMHTMIMKIVSKRNNTSDKRDIESQIQDYQSENHKYNCVKRTVKKFSTNFKKMEQEELTGLIYNFFHAYSLLWLSLNNKIKKTELMSDVTGHLDAETLKEYQKIFQKLQKKDVDRWIYNGQTEESFHNRQGVSPNRFAEYYKNFFDVSIAADKLFELFKFVCVELTADYNTMQDLKRTKNDTSNPYFVVI